MLNRHHPSGIKLEEAMTMELSQSVRIWDVDGQYIKDDNIPQNTNVKMTFVMRFPDGRFHLGIQLTVEGNTMPQIVPIAEFSTLKELKNEFPKLFELNGSLYAFF